MIKIPNNGKFSQPNNSDRFGNIKKTKNINFSKEGYIRQSPRMVSIMNTDDDADFDNADGMVINSIGVVVAADEVFQGDVGLDTLTQNSQTDAPSPGPEEGITIFEEYKIVTNGATFYYAPASNSTGAWTDVSTGLSGSGPTIAEPFPGKASLMVGRANEVELYNTSFSNTVTLTLPANYAVMSMATNGATAYIATRHTENGEAQMFTWDGNDTSATGSYPVGGFEMSSIVAYDSTAVGINSNGELLRFNGGGFTRLAALPIYYTDNEWCDASNDHSKVSDRGMVVDGELIYLVLDGRSEFSYPRRIEDTFLGGIWCYDPTVGLYHYNAGSQTTVLEETISTSDVNTTTDAITVTAAPVTGTPLYYDKSASSTVIGGLKQDGLYYAIYVDATHIKIAASAADAAAGTEIDLTSTGDNNHLMYFFEIKDFGWTYTDSRQAVAVLTNNIIDDQKNGRICATTQFNVSGGKTDWFSLSAEFPLLPQRSYFETARQYSSGQEDEVVSCNIKYKPLTDDESIIVKVKTAETEGLPVISPNVSDTATDWKGTWSDTDTFTTTVDLSGISAGDEIEIIAGIGAGCTFHISSITESSGTYTVNLDETFPWAAASDTFYFIADNWKKLVTINKTTQEQVGYHTFSVSDSGKFIEFKVEMRGNVEIQEFSALNKVHKGFNNV